MCVCVFGGEGGRRGVSKLQDSLQYAVHRGKLTAARVISMNLSTLIEIRDVWRLFSCTRSAPASLQVGESAFHERIKYPSSHKRAPTFPKLRLMTLNLLFLL